MTQINKQKLEGTVYSAPSISALDIEAEGLLCASMSSGTIESATEENWGEL